MKLPSGGRTPGLRLDPAQGLLPERATAAALLLDDAGRVLLERRPEEAAVAPGVWDSPGGHVEAGESPEQTLVRELDEELGVRPGPFLLVLVGDERELATGRFYRHFVYAVDHWTGTPTAREGQQLEWLALGSALELAGLHPIARRALQLLAAQRGDTASGPDTR